MKSWIRLMMLTLVRPRGGGKQDRGHHGRGNHPFPHVCSFLRTIPTSVA